MKVGFYMTVYRDELWAHRMALQIRKHYPGAPILITTDGPAHTPILSKVKGVTLLPFERRLKVFGYGGLYSHRNVEAASIMAEQHNLDIVFKVDPDSYLWRASQSFPPYDWFGGIFNATTSLGTNVCCAGGCWGMRVELLAVLAESKLLLSEALHAKDLCYPRYSARCYSKPGDNGRDRDLIIREDVMMGWACNELGVFPTAWDEVQLRQKGELVQEPPYPFAITHPVRTIP